MSLSPMWRSRLKRTSTAHVWCIRNKPPTLPSRSSRCQRMPSYDASDFDPPAPVARVGLRHPQSGATVSDVPVLLDTRADVTLLPRMAVERLGVPLLPDQRYEVMSFDGSRSFAPVVMLDLLFL